MYLGTEGIFGTPLEVSSTFVFMFILFGQSLKRQVWKVHNRPLDGACRLVLGGWRGRCRQLGTHGHGFRIISRKRLYRPCSHYRQKRRMSLLLPVPSAVASTAGRSCRRSWVRAHLSGQFMACLTSRLPPRLSFRHCSTICCHGPGAFEATRLGLKGIPWSQLPPLCRC